MENILSLLLPLGRLLLGLIIGIFVANLLEALNWIKFLSKFSQPLAAKANFGPQASSAFTLAFISPTQANALLSEGYANKDLSLRELILANLINGFPSYLVHLPTMLALTYPILGLKAWVYVGLNLLAGALRTLATLIYAHFTLPKSQTNLKPNLPKPPLSFKASFKIALKRLGKRLPKLLIYTIPIYILMYALQVTGCFASLNAWLANLNLAKSWLSPEACSIIFLHLLAELGSALGASSALLATGSLSADEVILALLIGNILSTPIRALRHQFPAYAGFYKPKLALILIVLNQSLRALSLILVICLYLAII
ncbi:MAG: hypothetical protein IJU40_01360 [Desulfovibrionaceae bacterium]|nr:hypothetical protein [Desulfovibrionaceae bacterium]